MNISLRHLHYAVGISRHRTLASAAEALHVSQPALSLALAQIEREMGQPLFVRRRGGPGLFPTPFGRRFMDHAKAVLQQMSALEGMADDHGVRGELVLGCFEDLAPFCLAPVLRDCSRRYPDLDLQVVEAGFDILSERLASGELDLAVTYDLSLPDGAERRTLSDVAPWAVLPSDHPLGGHDSVTLEDLAACPLVLSRQSHSAQHAMALFNARGLCPEQVVRIGSFELQRSFIAHGFGVGLAYTRPQGDRSYDGKPLVYRPVTGLEVTQRIVLAIGRFVVSNEAVDAIESALKSYFTQDYQAR